MHGPEYTDSEKNHLIYFNESVLRLNLIQQCDKMDAFSLMMK